MWVGLEANVPTIGVQCAELQHGLPQIGSDIQKSSRKLGKESGKDIVHPGFLEIRNRTKGETIVPPPYPDAAQVSQVVQQCAEIPTHAAILSSRSPERVAPHEAP